MHTRSTLLLAAFLGVAGSAVAQGSTPSPIKEAPSPGVGLSRAEVLADLELWHRAGMSYWPAPQAEMGLPLTAEYQAGMTSYQQLRAGPAFQETALKYQDRMPRQ